MTTDWIRVTKNQPCRICHKPDWCTVAADGMASCCMRVESNTQMRNGGWLHRLKDPAPRFEYRPPRDAGARRVTLDFGAIWRGWRKKTGPAMLEKYARSLGVSDQALDDLGAAWGWQHAAWAFPMRDSAGKIIGIRLRADSGRKWAVTGSHQGVFVPVAWPDMPDTALICEGPTDTAAALSLGFLAIGRPSCLGCELALIETCKRLAVRRVVIVADNDGPGRDGARKLASTIRFPNKTIIPPAKDFREWVRAGASKALVDCVINQKLWRLP